MSDLRVLQVRPDRFANWQDDLRTFEERFEYPLGDDHFHIDHGEDYLAFFRRLGEPAPFLATVARRVVGVLVAVRRRVGRREGWYLCDLKVDPVYARYRAATRLLTSWARARGSSTRRTPARHPAGARAATTGWCARCAAGAPTNCRTRRSCSTR
jgi:hypothetical protein